MSDKGFQGEREDTSGQALIELFKYEGMELCFYRIVPDQRDSIIHSIIESIDSAHADLVITTGGTGVSPSDITPECMDELFEKEVPGIAEAMRTESFKITPRAVISRGRAGIRGQSLIINLPGSKKAALENIMVVLPALSHAIEKIKGNQDDCAT
ncbi:MAG: MogA/MoaB family molybdenum cofactor biosynthesis protein [Desulfobulbaceae bacterium]|nr:MAG: MogA/MoaB family molybdenum cofactor biosynthesis protein [Desulfobulbaceae bacterium]